MTNLVNKIQNRLAKRYARQFKEDDAWAWQQVKNAVKDSTAAEKREIIAAFENTSIIRKFIDETARAEAESMLADGTLSADELSKILEDR